MTALHFNIVILALPHIARSLDVPLAKLQWVVTGFSLAYSGCLMLGGRAADLLGRRRTFVFSLIVFGIGSVIGAAAKSIEMVIAARIVQGVGGSILFPSTVALINTIFAEGVERNRALGVWSLISSSGATMGALAGGVLVASFGWQSVFLINVPIAAATAISALFALPTDGRSIRRRSFDIRGAIAAAASVTLLLCFLTSAPVDGLISMRSMLLFGGSIASAIICIAVERSVADPLIDGALLLLPGVRIAMVLAAVLMGTFMTVPYFLTLMFQNAYGYSPIETGATLFVPSLSIMLGTQMGARMEARVGVRKLLVSSLLVGAAGTFSLALAIDPAYGLIPMIPSLLLFGFGQGATWSGLWILAGQGVSSDRQGASSSLVSTAMWIGGGTGLALLVGIAHWARVSCVACSGISQDVTGTRAVLITATAFILLGALTAMAARSNRAT